MAQGVHTDEGADGGRAKHSVREDVDRHVRHKPVALERRHEVFGVDLGLEKVDTCEDACHECCKGEQPGIAVTAEGGVAYGGEEEGVPETCLANGAHGWSLQADPQAADKDGVDEGTEEHQHMAYASVFIYGDTGGHPAQHGGQGEPGEVVPSHFIEGGG